MASIGQRLEDKFDRQQLLLPLVSELFPCARLDATDSRHEPRSFLRWSPKRLDWNRKLRLKSLPGSGNASVLKAFHEVCIYRVWKGRPDPALPLFIFTTIPHPELPERKPFSFPILHTVPRFWRIPLPSSGQILYPVSKFCVFPNLTLYFGSNPGSRDNSFRPWIPYLQLFSH